MNSKIPPELPELEPRHFAEPETLTKEELRANHKDYLNFQVFYSQHPLQIEEIRRRKRFIKYSYYEFMNDGSYDKTTVAYFANKGFPTAKRLYEALDHRDKVKEMIENLGDKQSIISELAAAFRFTEFIWNRVDPLITQVAKPLIYDAFKNLSKNTKSQFDLDTRICYAVLLTKGVITFLEESIEKYPEEATFRVYLCQLLFSNFSVHEEGIGVSNFTDLEKGIAVANAGIVKFPNNCELIILKALHLYEVKKYEEMKDAYLKFLEIAPHDHYDLPVAYYAVATELCFEGAKTADFEPYYRWGIEAEKVRLPFFPLLECPDRDWLSIYFNMNKPGGAMIQMQYKFQQNASVRGLNALLGFDRVNLVRGYREDVKKIKQGIKFKRVEPRLRNRKVPAMEKINFLTLQEIIQQKVGGFKLGLKCSVAEEGIVVGSHIRVLVEDEDWKLVRVYVKSNKQELASKFQFGMKIKLLNLYVWRGDKDDIEIWIGGEEYIIFEGESSSKRCRFCWKKKATKKCVKCLSCFYCNKDCQEMDWIILNHNLVCQK